MNFLAMFYNLSDAEKIVFLDAIGRITVKVECDGGTQIIESAEKGKD